MTSRRAGESVSRTTLPASGSAGRSGGDMGDGSEVVTSEAPPAGIQVNQGLVVGGIVLVGLGGILGATGIMLVTTALVSATRRWMRQLNRPPRETARLRWEPAKAATA